MGFLVWIIVGLIAGWLTGQVMKGGSYGILGDIVVGILGGILGGFLLGLLGLGANNLIGDIIVAFIGGVILVAIVRAVTGRRAAV